ncbi:MAG: hypothetical protein ACRYFA_14525 [Janthinobacterium lividum]
MDNSVLHFLPVKTATGGRVIFNQLVFWVIMIFLGWLLLATYHYNMVSLIITGFVFIPLMILLPLTTKVVTQISIDVTTKTFTANYFNSIGQSKTLTLNLLNSVINYEFAISKSGGYWELRIYENIINKWFKVIASKKGFTKQQLDEIYAILQPYQQSFTPPSNTNKFIFTTVFTTLILAGFYLCVIYAFQQSRTPFYIGGFFLISGIMSLVFLWFYVMPVKKGNYGLSWFLTVALTLASAFLIDQLKNIYIKDQLKKYGITGYVQISNTYQTRGTNRIKVRNFATFGYTVNHQIYFKSIENEEGIYNIGDSVKITCSSVNPEIYIIAGRKNASNKSAKITSHN